MSKIIRTSPTIASYFKTKNIDEKTFAPEIDDKFAFLAPQFYLDKIDWKNPADPLRKMIWPDEKELVTKSYQLTDPIGDENYLAIPNLIHRYPDRALILLTANCQVNCRFCFRRALTHQAHPLDLEQITSYLWAHPEIREVIFSGGDPLALSAKYLTQVYQKIATVPTIKVIRFHTRIPVVNPDAVGKEYLQLFAEISTTHNLVLVFHLNHPQEFSPELKTLTTKCKNLGATILSQTVLLKGVNDDPTTLANLFNGMMDQGIKPYYLHHPDLVIGTDHFRLSIEEGKKIYQATKNKISGISLPQYVLDLPGGKGKVPVTELILTKKPGEYYATTFRNEVVLYLDPNLSRLKKPATLPDITAKSA